VSVVRFLVALAKCRARGALSFGDALILAQMQAAGCSEIYSFDTHFRDEAITVLDRSAT
jgi:predicted nucleic acid-binding protein